MTYTSREVYEFISQQTNDSIVERKTCRVSGQLFPIYQSDLDFYAKISPTFDGKKFAIPTPTLCPEERQRRRLSFRNERKLYKRTCDATGENIISIYSPDKSYKVYDQKFRRSDNRDPMDYGREFDFLKTFTEQFGELMREVPRISLLNGYSENSDYANHAWYQKNCYLSFAAGENENCMYGSYVNNSLDCVDCINVQKSQFIYEGVNCIGCFDCSFIQYAKHASHCHYSTNIENCSYCYGCVGLQDKKYCIYNKQYDEETYKLLLGKIVVEPDSIHSLLNKLTQQGMNLGNSVSCIGNDINNSHESLFIFDSFDADRVKYATHVWGGDNIYDCDIAGTNSSQNLFEGHTVIGSKNIFGNLIWGGNNNYYCDYFLDICSDCFGCIGLRNKKYCIFNKQYTKEEYENQVAKIISHMQTTGERGEFFDPSLSQFGYNETVAQEYYPSTAEKTKSMGYKRSDYNADTVIPAGAQVLQGDQISSDITKVTDDILKAIFVCEVSGRPFRIIKQELEFYRKHNLPLPRKHPDVRHEERMKLRPGRTLHLRTCASCSKEMLSVYPQAYEGKVCCEDCYKKEVYA